MPAALSPWPYDCLAPTPRLDQNLSVSPVNWDNVKGVTEPQVEAYEMRAPWNHKPTTFAEVAKQTEFKRNGEIPSEEGIRKRFKAASLAVFRISGVYFDTSCVALLRLCCCHLKCLEAQQNKTIPSSKTRKRPVSRNMWRVSNFVVWCAVSRPLRLGLPRIITTDSACRFGRWYQQM